MNFRRGTAVTAAPYQKNWPCVLLALIVLGAAPLYAQSASGDFAAASAAFDRGDYRRALELFEQIRAAGGGSAALEYNIAVCRYKLGDYASAERDFAALAANAPQMRDLAEYNRGLALLAQERRADARGAFAVARASFDPTIAELAARALASLGDADTAAAPGRWLGSADVAAGYDDNVALLDDASLPAAESSGSAFIEAFGFASRRFATLRPSRVDLTGYAVDYPEAGGFDQQAARVGFAVRRSFESWTFDAGPHLSYTTLGGDSFERQLGFDLQAVHALTDAAALDIRFVYDDVADLAPQFSYIEGSRRWLRFTFDRRGPAARVRVSYDFERNDRAAPTVSADRNRLALRVTRALDADWELDVYGAYRKSRHDRLVPASDEELMELSVTATRALASAWSLETGYYWADNDSDVAVFAYGRNRLSIGLTRLF